MLVDSGLSEYVVKVSVLVKFQIHMEFDKVNTLKKVKGNLFTVWFDCKHFAIFTRVLV